MFVLPTAAHRVGLVRLKTAAIHVHAESVFGGPLAFW
jgi:hypothetical protein